MSPESFEKQLCALFCTQIDVRAVPAGLAVSTAVQDGSGDPIQFFIVEDPDGLRLEDDGLYLSHVVARDIPIDAGQRADLLTGILSQGDAFWDRDTYQIRSQPFAPDQIARKTTGFLSALIRVRDLELLTREAVRSTFRDDAAEAIRTAFSGLAEILSNESVDTEFNDFPADIVIRPKEPGVRSGAVFFATNNERLQEALLFQNEAQLLGRDDVAAIALIEDSDLRAVSRRKFQRAQNRGLTMPIFRGDETAAMNSVGRVLGFRSRYTGATARLS